MRKRLFVAGLALLFAIGMIVGSALAASTQSVLVDLSKVNPHIAIDLRYATENNFLKTKVYVGADETRCLMLEPLAKKLDQAQKILEKDGLGLKVYDGYRPVAVQKRMWAIMPDARYVANPYKGGSLHNKGAAVDLTLVDSHGQEIEMPTPFDTFAERAWQFSPEPTPQQRANRMLLRSVMSQVGLQYIRTEWWHYQLPDAAKYPILP